MTLADEEKIHNLLREEIGILEEQERKYLLTMKWIMSKPEILKQFAEEIMFKDLEEYPRED